MVEKRRIQRVKFGGGIDGSLSGLTVMIVDLSTVGVRIEHEFPLAVGRRVRLDFTDEGQKITVQCEVVRSKLQRSVLRPDRSIVYHTGLRYTDSTEPARDAIRKIVASMLVPESPSVSP